MKQILGRKQTSPNEQWIDAAKRIEELVTAEELDRAVATTVERMKQVISGKNVAYAWSGGKDSIVLSDICEKNGISDCVFAHAGELEYSEFLTWCLEHKPEQCEVIDVGLNLEWLAKHPYLLFPRNCRAAYRWYQLVQQTAIRKYFKSHNLDMILVGHRKADGNYVGKGSNISRNGIGVVRYSPLADWSHELILAYIHYNHLALPPIYGWKNGYKCGTHPWPARMYAANIDEGFKEVYAIDPEAVERAAVYIPEARHFLKGGDEK